MRKHLHFLLFLLNAAMVTSCAMALEDGEVSEESVYIMVEPTLSNVGPTEISLGESLVIRGKDFVPSSEGQMMMHITGSFTDSKRQEHTVNTELRLNVENPGLASASLERVIFHPQHNDIGTFRGSIKLSNRRSLGGGKVEELNSNTENSSIRVLPSVHVARLRSVDSAIACTEVTNATIKNHQIELGVQALGAGVPSLENPWIVKVGFFAPQMDVYYISPDQLDDDARFWPLTWLDIDGRDSNLVKKIEEGNHQFELKVDQLEEGGVIKIDPSRIPHMVKANPAVEINGQTFDEVLLGGFRGGTPDIGGKITANIAVEIVVPNGPTLRRSIPFDIFDGFEIPQQYDTYLVQRFDPEIVDNCTPCPINGPQCEFVYEDNDTTTKERSRGTSWDNSTSQDLGSTYGEFNNFSITATNSWAATFGANYGESYSVSKQEGRRLSVPVIPGYYAQRYRQLVQLEKRVDIIYHNACGVSGVVGQALLTDWNTSFEIATGPTCEPPPQTRYPAGQTHNPPVPHGGS